MFAYDDMKESQNNRVEITDVLPDVMQDLLQYIYTGTTQAIEKIPEEILQAAEKVSARRLMLPLFLITWRYYFLLSVTLVLCFEWLIEWLASFQLHYTT